MAAPKLRFKEFDADWISNKIIDLADYVDYRGKTPKKVESGILLVTAKNIKQGYLDYSASQEFIEESAFDDVMRRGKVELNDVLITTEAPLGNVASVDRTDIALAQRVIKYRGKIDLLDNLFLKQKFLSESFQEILKSKATGGTVQGIKGSVLHQIPLIVPSKQEQTKIASFLSAVDEKISQLTQKHALLSQYKQGMMQKLFSQQIRFKADDGSEFGEWEEKTLGSLGVFKSGQGFPEKYQGGKTGVPFFKVSDMNTYGNEKRMVVANNYVDADSILEMKVKVILDESIIFAKVGAAVFLERKRLATNFLIDNNMMAFTPDPKLNINFIKQFLDTIKFSNFVQVGALPSYNAGDLAIIPIHIPCVVEQTKIANFLSAIDQKIDVVAQQIEQTKQWKKGLLQQMFV